MNVHRFGKKNKKKQEGSKKEGQKLKKKKKHDSSEIKIRRMFTFCTVHNDEEK